MWDLGYGESGANGTTDRAFALNTALLTIFDSVCGLFRARAAK